MELSLHAIQRADGPISRHRCTPGLASPYVLQACRTHQALHGAARNIETLTA